MTPKRLAAAAVRCFSWRWPFRSSVLVYQAYGQLKWEAFYQHQRLARDLRCGSTPVFAT